MVTQEELTEIVQNAIPDYLHQMRYYLEHDDPRRVIWYWASIGTYLNLIGRTAEHIACEQYALAALQQVEPENEKASQRLQALSLDELAFTFRENGQMDEAQMYFQQAQDLWQRLGEWLGLGLFSHTQAQFAKSRGDAKSAIGYCKKGLAILEEAERQGPSHDRPVSKGLEALFRFLRGRDQEEQIRRVRVSLYNELGIVYHYHLLRFPDAVSAYRNALACARLLPSYNNIDNMITPMANLGWAWIECANVRHARQCFAWCLKWSEGGYWPVERAEALWGLAVLAKQEHQWDLAFALASESEHLYEQTGQAVFRKKVHDFIEEMIQKHRKEKMNPGDDESNQDREQREPG